MSDYIQNPLKYESIIADLESAAFTGLKELMYLTNNLRCDFGRETPSFEVHFFTVIVCVPYPVCSLLQTS